MSNYTQQLTGQDLSNYIAERFPKSTEEVTTIMETSNPNQFHAQPYDISKTGFYFSTMEEYETKAELSGAEEFELQYIDGEDCELFNACGINQSNLSQWFDEVETLDEWQKIAIFYLTSVCGYDLEDALNKKDDASIQQDDLESCAIEFFDECYAHEIPDNLRFYIDYKAFARDCEIGGDMTEFEYSGLTYTCTNANGI